MVAASLVVGIIASFIDPTVYCDDASKQVAGNMNGPIKIYVWSVGALVCGVLVYGTFVAPGTAVYHGVRYFPRHVRKLTHQ